MILRRLLGLLAPVLCATSVMAQYPNPVLEFVYPAGGQLGTQVRVQIGGRDLDDASQLVFSHGGITAQPVMREPAEFEVGPQRVANEFAVSVAPTVPPGAYEARVVGRFGVSTPRAFVVGEVPEVLETGDNHAQAQAMPVPLDTVIHGRTDGGTVDFYRFRAEAGQTLVVACLAAKIDSALQPVVTIWDARGNQLARTRQTLDPVLPIKIPATDDYLIGVQDHVFGGGTTHAYRLRLHTGPYIVTSEPAAARGGTVQSFTVHGYHLPGQVSESPWKLGEVPLEQMTLSAFVPAPGPTDFDRGNLAPVQFEVASAAIGTLGPAQFVAGWQVGLAEQPLVSEVEPNGLPDKAQLVSLPCEVSGRFYPRRDQDWVAFPAKSGERIQIRVYSHRLGAPTDPEIFVQKVVTVDNGAPQVSQVSTDDDFRATDQRIRSALRRGLEIGHRDPSVSFVADADATYRVGLRDLGGSSLNDPRLAYRLVIERQQPTFALLAWSQQQAVDDDKKIDASGLNLRAGGTVPILVDVQRRGGWDGPIRLSVEGLPEGVLATPAEVSAGQTEGAIVLTATSQAPAWVGAVQVIGTAEIQGQAVRRVALAATLMGATGNIEASRPVARSTTDLRLAVVGVDPQAATVTVARSDAPDGVWRTSLGGKLSIPVTYQRTGTIKGELTLVPIGTPAEAKAANVVLAADAAGGNLELVFDNAKVAPGRYAMFLRGKVPLSYARNPQGIEAAVAQRQAIDQKLQELAQQTELANQQLNEAKAQLALRAEQIVKAQQTQTTTLQALDAAATQLADAQKQLAALKDLAQTAGNPADIQTLVQTAEANAVDLTAQLQQTRVVVEQLQQRLASDQTLAQSTQQGVAQAEQRVKEFTDKKARADEYVKVLDQRVTEAQTNWGPKDLTVYVDSTPLIVELAPVPIEVRVTPLASSEPTTTQYFMVHVGHRFGFQDVVTAEWEVPEGMTLVDAKPTTLGVATHSQPFGEVAGRDGQPAVPASWGEGVLKLQTAQALPAGQHGVTLRLSLKFNGLDLQHRLPVTLQVPAP